MNFRKLENPWKSEKSNSSFDMASLESSSHTTSRTKHQTVGTGLVQKRVNELEKLATDFNKSVNNLERKLSAASMLSPK